jgi:hypothetical protein
MARIAVAISGGGYRASAWGLGVLWALADSGLNTDVTMVSSVSGGSLTNAHAGWLAQPYSALPPGAYEAPARAYGGRLAGRPPAFNACLLVTLLAGVVGWVAVAHGWTAVLLAAVGVAVLAGVVGSLACGDLLFNRLEIWLYVDGLLALVGLLVWAWPSPWLVALALLGVGTYAELRGPVVGWCMGASLKSLLHRADTTLGGLNAEPMHVILATELHAGRHMCFARDFVYNYDVGLGARPGLPVRTAVQASANLPGAFPTRWVRTASMGLVGGAKKTGWLALSDGGVYDNMADQWPMGVAARVTRWQADPAVMSARGAAVAAVAAHAPDLVVVANASGAMPWKKVGRTALPLLGELLGLMRVKDVLYNDGTAVRRQWIVQRFDQDDPPGTLVHIATSPYAWPGWVAKNGDATTKPRAAAVLAWLGGLGVSEADWDARMAAARSVGTQLWPLGEKALRNVVNAAYVQTAANLHIRTGAPLGTPPYPL